MAFSDWKKRNTIMDSSIPKGYQAMAYRVAQAAYKAGERDAEKRMETELQEVLREIARLRTAFPLLREVMVLHQSQDSPEYNECEESLCMWCEMAAKIMTTNS